MKAPIAQFFEFSGSESGRAIGAIIGLYGPEHI
jgi:hypothetical protein